MERSDSPIRSRSRFETRSTASLQALRDYSQALRADDRGDAENEITLLRAAIAADSTFAMAWRKLGTLSANRADQTGAVEALTRAYQLREHLTFRERKLAEDSYFSDVASLPDSATAALQGLLAEYPSDSWALNNLGVAQQIAGDRTAAEQSYFRAASGE